MARSVTAGAVLLLASLAAASELHSLSDEFISLINSQQNSWTAGQNFPKDTPTAYIKRLMGVIKDDTMPALPVKEHDADLIASLPEKFDSREKWPNCLSLNEIRDQGSCGSCWAMAAVEVMTDRVCILSNGTKSFHFSAEDLISCVATDGCSGGDETWAFRKWVEEGLVSGGPYNSSEGCMPYLLEPCEHHVPGKRNPCTSDSTTPVCERKCRADYNVEYKKDKRHGKEVYKVENEDHIKAELFKNGPVTAAFAVYNDFLNYKTGVYTKNDDNLAGFHAVKMLGWGEEGGKKYWLIANSWNTDWGDKGFFKILRGKNECGIEEDVTAAKPNLDEI